MLTVNSTSTNGDVMAGESAREQAERQWGGTATPSGALWDTSADSEASIGRALEELRASPGWTVLHDVPWPGQPQDAFDHVVIGPSGVFVIDAKNWTGEITVEGEELRANGWSRVDAVRHAATAAQALADSLPEGLAPRLVQPVLCFTRDEWVSERIGDVLICSSQNVVAQLKTRRHVLDHATVERLAADLALAVGAVEQALAVEEALGTDPAEPVDEVEVEVEPDPVEPEPEPEPTEPVDVPAASRPGAGRHGRARRRFGRRSRVTQVIGGLGLLAVVAFRPDTLQPVGSFVSDLLVQEADADNGDSSTEPTAKAKQGKDGKPTTQATTQANDPGEQQGEHKARQGQDQGRRRPDRQAEEPARLNLTG